MSHSLKDNIFSPASLQEALFLALQKALASISINSPTEKKNLNS